MINLDDRLLSELDSSEYWLLTHLAKRMGKERTCWPSNSLLQKETGWHIEKLIRVKRSLESKGLITSAPQVGKSTVYRIESRMIGVYVNGKSDPPGKSVNGDSDNVKPDIGESGDEVLTSYEVLPNSEVLTPKEREVDFRLNDIYSISLLIQRLLFPINSSATDSLSKDFEKKIEAAAGEIVDFYTNNPRPEIPGYRDDTGLFMPADFTAVYESRQQIEAYFDYTRLTGTRYRVSIEKLSKHIVGYDWCKKLLDHANSNFPKQYDPRQDYLEGNLESHWLLQFFYFDMIEYYPRATPGEKHKTQWKQQ